MWKKVVAVLVGVLVGIWLFDDFDKSTLKGKRVLITGASTGIGEQMAYHYAQMGAKIVVTARREQKLKEVVAKCREAGDVNGQYEYIPADMGDMPSTLTVVQEAVKKLGGLDILVLNHITLIPLTPWNGSRENLTLLDNVININFRAYIHLASHALPHIEKSHGSIIVVSSYAGKVGQPFLTEYSASKFALDGFFSSLRQEMKIKNCDVSITLCVIGFIGTENAVHQLEEAGQQFLIDFLKPASPSDAALAIIKGGVKRAREMYFPYFQVKPILLMKEWFPELCDFINRFVYTQIS
ncbi:hypothetical protein ACJMK2_025572 [Sinanodonta woodiana]|uniref:Hydroxysteroid 11-beta-dehydrogenase 1-like protein n=1 Tax=Sinanodonta woodiana TaxID=1069815 RepID=A0ABD3XKP2_SINWO